MIDMNSFASALRLDEDGIWRSAHSESVSYPEHGHTDCFAVEDASFWFKHRNDCIVSMIKRFPFESSAPIFDIGGGNGYVCAGLLDAGFKAVLIEPGQAGASNAKKRGVQTVVCATTDTARIATESLPAVGLFDVIEHMEDDVAFLGSIRKLMRPNGMLYATVPAYRMLWSHEDIIAGHYRRYSRKTISKALSSSGFQVVYASHFFQLLPLPIFLLRTLPYKLGISRQNQVAANMARDHKAGSRALNRILASAHGREIRKISAGSEMGFGGSCILAARAV